jgi:hypothetical protein
VRRHPHLTEENVAQPQEGEDLIDKEVKQRGTRRSTQKSFSKLGYQIIVHMKPNSTKKSCLNISDVQMEDGLWCQIVGNYQIEEHLIKLNVEQFYDAGATSMGYM